MAADAPGWDARIAGVCPVVETPFRLDGAVDVDSFQTLLSHLGRTGVTSLMFPGFASEFHKLSDAEVELLTVEFIEGAGAAAPVVSVPTHATVLACRAAASAADRGAAAINVLPPYFLGPSAGAVRAHVEAVARAVAPLPVIVQYAPAQTGAALSAAAIEEIADRCPNLVAVKVESSPPEEMIEELGALRHPLDALVGYAGLSLPEAVRAGVRGVQPGCSFTELYRRIWDRYAAGDLQGGDAEHARLRPYLERWMDGVEHIVAVEKQISARRGLIATPSVRAPGCRLGRVDVAEIDRFLGEFASELVVG